MASEVTKLIMETILGLITTAFAFVAGLAWNDAIQKLIEQFIGTGDALPSLFIYAIVVTVSMPNVLAIPEYAKLCALFAAI